MEKSQQPAFTADGRAIIDNSMQQLNHATKFIPTWVKVAVAIALGLGTMVGWERIVVTVGEKSRQAAPDLRPGCVGGGGRDADHWGRGCIWAPDVDHARADLRRCLHDGGKWIDTGQSVDIPVPVSLAFVK